MTATASAVLDPGQLRRIENVHRGFLYQHLFGAAALLLAPRSGVLAVLAERDEDIELRLADRHVYCQVKTRSSPLQGADIDSSLLRFDAIRTSHNNERGPSRAEFWIIANVPPSQSLAARIASPDWPSDVRLSFPETDHPLPPYLPPSWHDVPEALRWCTELASQLPYSRVSGETLTWKLAAMVLHASSGSAPRTEHTFHVSELPQLFELITVQFQRFPPPPSPYRELESEPAFASERRVRLIVGHPGSGKTSWAAEANRHVAGGVAYFNLGDVSASGFPAALARELGARFLVGAETLGTILAPGVSGLDALRVLDSALEIGGIPRLVVVDNCHHLPCEAIASAVHATTSLRWMVLSQAGTETSHLAATLEVEPEFLAGFTLDSIAAEFNARRLVIDAGMANRIRVLTGGSPLFVRQAAVMAESSYASDIARMCTELEERTHSVTTAQERLLATTLKTLSPMAHTSALLLSLSDVPLSSDECRSLLSTALSATIPSVATCLRELDTAGVTQADGRVVQMHDSFRLVAGGCVSELPEGAELRALTCLRDLLTRSLQEQWDLGRQAFLLRLLPRTGDTKALIDIATSNDELFAELGFIPLVWPVLERAAADTLLRAEERFWALDTLVFWNLQNHEFAKAGKQLPLLEQLYEQSGTSDSKQLAALLLKQILLAGRTGVIARARKAFRQAATRFASDAELLRIFRYDFAVALFHSKNLQGVVSITEGLIPDYYDALGLEPEDVMFKNPPEIAAKLDLENPKTQDNIKRLADTLELHAMALSRLGGHGPLARMHAHKFFIMAHAVTSAVRVGQDVVDELMNMGDFAEALKFLEEGVLRVVQHFRLFDRLVPVRAQRAVILAYLGRAHDAVEEMTRLQDFGLTDLQSAELVNQRRLVESLVRRPIPQRVRHHGSS